MGPNPLQCFQAGRRVPGDREVVYRLEADPQGTRADCYWLSGAGVDRLGRQLAVPEDAGGRARLFASQFLSDLDDLRRDRPAVFYGGLLLMGGAIAVVIVPSLSKRTLCRLGAFSVTAGLAVKVPLVMLGGYGVSHSVDHYCELEEMEPTTAVGQYFVEREKIVEGGTAIVAASGIVMLSAETGFILAAHRASQAGRTRPRTPWRKGRPICASTILPSPGGSASRRGTSGSARAISSRTRRCGSRRRPPSAASSKRGEVRPRRRLEAISCRQERKRTRVRNPLC